MATNLTPDVDAGNDLGNMSQHLTTLKNDVTQISALKTKLKQLKSKMDSGAEFNTEDKKRIAKVDTVLNDPRVDAFVNFINSCFV